MKITALGLFVSIDPLSLFFLAVIALVTVPSFIYSFGYLKAHYTFRKSLLCQLLAVLFVLSMAAVVCAGNMLVFLVAWELMSLISYFLVVFDHEQAQAVRAGLLYIIMTHVGTAFLFAGFLLMYAAAGSWDFAALKSACALMSPAMRNLVFILLFLGFGTKAGIVPLHIWLPAAHPQAPSHISSIMSGVMIKTAVYGIIRFIIQVLGVSCTWWGIAILSVAAVTCLVGIIYALMERDLKRMLAYSSVENIGIVLLGIGGCVLFLGLGLSLLAALSLAAALYHLINHAAFKGLLFLGAGSVYNGTHTRDMEKLGGLIKKMPYTAVFFLIGALAISGMPPLNGFVSEWLTLQVFFQGAWGTGLGMIRLFLGVCAAVLAVTGGLAAACFVKAFGIGFLALPRSEHAEHAAEAPFSMRAGMALLALVCIALGLFAVPVFRSLFSLAGGTLSVDTYGLTSGTDLFTLMPQVQGQAWISTPWIAVLLIAGAVLALIVFRPGKAAAYRTWDCGYYRLTSRNEYTATAQSKPFRIAFSFFLLPYKRTQKIRESFYHFTSFVYETRTTPVFGKFLYRPIAAGVFRTASFMKRLQAGSIHVYIGYIFLTLVALLVFLK